MKRFALVLLLIASVAYGANEPMGSHGYPGPVRIMAQQQTAPPAVQAPPVPRDAQMVEKWHTFNGAWLPDEDPAQIGPTNYRDLQNMRPTETSLQGVQGYSKINSTGLGTYLKIRNGFNLRTTEYTQQTYTLVQAENTGLTASQVLLNKTAIGSTGDFEGTAVQTDGTGAGLGRFWEGPQGTVLYANGVENKIWAGDETRCAALFTVTPKEATEADVVYDNAAKTCVTTAGQFYTDGLRAGNEVTIAGGSNDASSFYIAAISANGKTLTFTDAPVDDAADTSTLSTDRFMFVADETADINSSNSSTYISLGNKGFGKTNPNDFIVFSTRPLKGVVFDVKTANDTSSTLSCQYWDGTDFTAVGSASDGTKPGAIAFAQDGTFSFTSTVGNAVPYSYEGIYLYAYAFTLSAGTAQISHVTVDAPWQSFVDVWDGVSRQPIMFQFWDESADTFNDYTIEINEESGTYVASIGAMQTDDYIIVMFEEKISGINFVMDSTKTNTAVTWMNISYWDGDSYAQYTSPGVTKTDGTIPDYTLSSFGRTGLVSWTTDGGEELKTEFGVTGYSYKIETASLPLSADVDIDCITGIPAALDIDNFVFTSSFQNRALLCNFKQGNEASRVDYSVTNAPDVWNGSESSMGGIQSLYFGGSSALTAGTQLYNRFGSNIFVTWVALKKNETYLLTGSGPEDFSIKPISYNVGCPAPLTLATAEIGYDMAQDVTRNIAIWLSSNGVVVFDGAVINFIKGIDKYFDTSDPDCINYSAIENSRGWFDPKYREYNLLIPTGGSTTCDEWLAYSLIHKKWFRKVPSNYPQAGWQASSTGGEKYTYGAIDTGFMLELENGTAWVTDSIEQLIETGDFFPTGSLWDLTRIRKLKFAGKRVNTDYNVVIVHYFDTDDSLGMDCIWTDTDDTEWSDTDDCEWVSSALASIELPLETSKNRITRSTLQNNLYGWAHRFLFYILTDADTEGFEPLAWGYVYRKVRRDE